MLGEEIRKKNYKHSEEDKNHFMQEKNNNNNKNKRREQQEKQQQESSNKRKKKEVAVFGNYRNYYGYRIDKDLGEDPRLKVMKKEWFMDKDCLDIGCNSGLITITIAKNFGCRSILGIDIDGARVEDAHWTLRKIARMSTRETAKSADAEKESSSGRRASNLITDFVKEKPGGLQGRDLFEVVSFQKGNFVQSWHPPENTYYHAIICLSVTKWIHLNWGDEGLINLFAKAWRLLRPGGVFIVEPQPWTSYYNNRLVSEITKMNYNNIEIHPEEFQEILLDKIGFRMVENMTSQLSDSKSGFNRPVLAFWK